MFDEFFKQTFNVINSFNQQKQETEEFTEAEIDGEYKIYVDGKWLTFDSFIELFKHYRDKAVSE